MDSNLKKTSDVGHWNGSRRKRERSHPEEDLACMPLSKRITFLNLNPNATEEERRQLILNNNVTDGPWSGSHNQSHSQGSSSLSGMSEYSSQHDYSDSQASNQSVSDYSYPFNGSPQDIIEEDNDMNSTDDSMNGELPNSMDRNRYRNPIYASYQTDLERFGNVTNNTEHHGFQIHNSNSTTCDVERPAHYPYQPTLDHVSNPYYYEQNRNLFDLYIERMQRLHISPHQDLMIRQDPNLLTDS